MAVLQLKVILPLCVLVIMGALLSKMTSLFWNPITHTTEFDTPLPKVLHQVLDNNIVQNRRVFVVGDIHGCYDELQALLMKADVLKDDAVVIFAGDLVNKGPKSTDVLQFIRENTEKYQLYAVRGNHDEKVILEYSRNKDPSYTLTNKYKWVTDLTENDIDYLSELPYTISIPSLKSLVVHAGIVPGIPLAKQQPIHMTTMRNIISLNNNQFEISKYEKDGVAWGSLWKGPNCIYYGHDAKRGLQEHPFAVGLDTGCVYGKKLTGVFIHSPGTRRYVSVDAQTVYRAPKDSAR
ncbi:uncharacterized protein LOC106179988 [Lingula anatina]|uniref:Uncharacterized protein LOC106179988 n=1 Tax=Lingula anatina TaxID=7574 RepID=A0A1S3K9H2_LINAN|nr:uncharacterized protein LOC106179988 [Lingula anatina]|eukprot:XP_013419278.1 uncharacterized protein LOC106179988 [Lingula anatina]